MNLPNKLTVLRMCLIPFFVIFMEYPFLGGADKYIAVAIFIIASITDMLDGKIARKYNLVTNFGKFIIIISRELIISGFRTIAADNGIVIAASYWGKIKTVCQMLMIIWLILDLELPFYHLIGQVLIYVSLILTIISLADYIAKNKEVLKDTNH